MTDDTLADLFSLRSELLAAGRSWADELGDVHASHRESARNLAHYLALRRHDLRRLQPELTRLGLSSLGRTEAHVFAGVDAATTAAARLAGIDPPTEPPAGPVPTFDTGPALLAERTAALLGPEPEGRTTRIMVTLPSEAATDPALVRRFVDEGMDCARINCAHDGPDAWRSMAANVRSAAADAGRPIAIMTDLAGPKIRTGGLRHEPGVVKVRPRRDPYGNVLEPARVELRTTATGTADVIGVPVELHDGAELAVGTRLRLRDARGSRRRLLVVSRTAHGWIAETRRTTYLVEGTELRAEDGLTAVVGGLPLRPVPPRLQIGDHLVLTDGAEPAAATGPDRISCTAPEIIDDLRAGQPVWFDDGKFGSVVERVDDREAHLRITRAPPGGAPLKPEKGINLPGTELHVEALSTRDRADLAVVAEFADCVALSFVQRPGDIDLLLEQLDRIDARHLGVVIKIESQVAFERLPELAMALMRHERVGVMIARGDLAVECGFERLAEVQEEIMWLCEAAHMPAVWATQVLETLAKTGRPSRAEITDAAMGDRAECVMLNKGPYVDEAIALLVDIFGRMQTHQSKKRALLRRLRSWS
ncbi:MAG: pyruvate kinase [Actinomycetota bacterium]